MKKRIENASVIFGWTNFLESLLYQTFAATDGLSLNVTYDAKCGESTTFTLNASGDTYYLVKIIKYIFNDVNK